VDAAGYIKAKKAGTVKITAKTSDGKKATTKLTVDPVIKAVAVTVTPDQKTMSSSKKTTLKAALVTDGPNVPSNDVVEWSSSNEKIATVTDKGKVTAIMPGKATITARAAHSGVEAGAVITVRNIEIDPNSVRITPGERFRPNFKDYGLSNTSGMTYFSSDESIATVTDNGYVQANFRDKATGRANVGTVEITGENKNGDSASFKITVSDEPTIVDLSKWQGNIDWAQAAPAFDLAILRVTYGADASYEPKYKTYADNCEAYDVPYGAYSFALYKNKSAALKEANAFYKQATSDGRMPLFFVLDIEESFIKRADTEAYIARLRELAEADGYTRLKIGVYIGHHLYNTLKLNLDTDPDNAKTPDFVWIPRYNTPNNGTLAPTAKRPDFTCDLWQYSSGAYFPGIIGMVDVNTLYEPGGDPLSEKESFSFDWLIAGPEAA
jgi:GH25 family lysozyme M1 (1,4-beta-N-acetylmuramidase)